jgi:hypothetical protein
MWKRDLFPSPSSISGRKGFLLITAPCDVGDLGPWKESCHIQLSCSKRWGTELGFLISNHNFKINSHSPPPTSPTGACPRLSVEHQRAPPLLLASPTPSSRQEVMSCVFDGRAPQFEAPQIPINLNSSMRLCVYWDPYSGLCERIHYSVRLRVLEFQPGS